MCVWREREKRRKGDVKITRVFGKHLWYQRRQKRRKKNSLFIHPHLIPAQLKEKSRSPGLGLGLSSQCFSLFVWFA
jgi:hypothetical protein